MPAKKNSTSAKKYPSDDIKSIKIMAAKSILENVNIFIKVVTN